MKDSKRFQRVHLLSLNIHFAECPDSIEAFALWGIAAAKMLQLRCIPLLNKLLLCLSVVSGEAAQEVLTESSTLSNETLLWGPYRPNLYFGVRPRIPKSLMTGLLWAKVDGFQNVQGSKFALMRFDADICFLYAPLSREALTLCILRFPSYM